MAFGQASGPPAPQRRVAELAGLLEARGFDSFKEARHPFGLTQRQAAGKFTTGEVDELIDRLEGEVEAAVGVDAPSGETVTETPDQRRRRERDEEVAVRLDADVMATELVNRGWCCIPPPD